MSFPSVLGVFSRLRLTSLCLILLLPMPLKSDVLSEFKSFLPENQLDLDLIAEIAFLYSDSAAELRNELSFMQTAELEARGQNRLDASFSSEFSAANDRYETLGAFNPTASRLLRVSSRYQKLLESGTAIDVNASIAYNKQELSVQAQQFGFRDSFSQGEAGAIIRQSLWGNRFGKAVKDDLAAALMEPELIELRYENALGGWFLDISALYDQAYLAQNNYRASLARLKTQKRLLDITRLSFKRGTAERADVLNIEAQILMAEQNSRQAKKQLDDIWRQLLILLKLPERFFSINPAKLPLAAKDFANEANLLCSPSMQTKLLEDSNPRIQVIDLLIKQLSLKLSATKERTKPDAYALLGIGSNSYSRAPEASFGEVARIDHPRLTAGVGISMDLGHSSLNAAQQKLLKQIKELEINRRSIKDGLKVQSMNLCAEKQRLVDVLRTGEQMIEKTSKRLELEEQRFKIGRTDIFTVITASNDEINASLSTQNAKLELSRVVWSLKDLHGQLADYVKLLAERNSLKGVLDE